MAAEEAQKKLHNTLKRRLQCERQLLTEQLETQSLQQQVQDKKFELEEQAQLKLTEEQC